MDPPPARPRPGSCSKPLLLVLWILGVGVLTCSSLCTPGLGQFWFCQTTAPAGSLSCPRSPHIGPPLALPGTPYTSHPQLSPGTLPYQPWDPPHYLPSSPPPRNPPPTPDLPPWDPPTSSHQAPQDPPLHWSCLVSVSDFLSSDFHIQPHTLFSLVAVQLSNLLWLPTKCLWGSPHLRASAG